MGKFQDGALRHNNPISIALWECDRIWPRETPKDVVLSLGTGRTATVTTPQAVSPDHTVNSKFIPRLCRSFLTGLDGEMAWRQLLNHVGRDDEKRYFRLNVDLAGPEPRLDDLRAMEQLSREVVTRGHDNEIREIKLALLASCFFFELRQAPRFDPSGFYICQGEIRTRIDYTKVFMALRQTSLEPIEFFKDHMSLGPIDRSTDVCAGCYRFRKRVYFFVRHPDEYVNLSMKLGEYQRELSGFPQSMAWMTAAQNLASPFYSGEQIDLLRTTCACFEQILRNSVSLGTAGAKRISSEAPSGRRRSKRLRRHSNSRMSTAEPDKVRFG